MPALTPRPPRKCAACLYELRTGRAAPPGGHECDPLNAEYDTHLKLPKKPPRKATETNILLAIRSELTRRDDVVLFRNNVGMLKDGTGRPVKYGLGVGSADLIGSVTVDILTGDLVDCPLVIDGAPIHYPGHRRTTIARSLAIEVKRPGKKRTPEQIAWGELVTRMGWIYGVATSVADAVEIVERGKRWEI